MRQTNFSSTSGSSAQCDGRNDSCGATEVLQRKKRAQLLGDQLTFSSDMIGCVGSGNNSYVSNEARRRRKRAQSWKYQLTFSSNTIGCVGARCREFSSSVGAGGVGGWEGGRVRWGGGGMWCEGVGEDGGSSAGEAASLDGKGITISTHTHTHTHTPSFYNCV